MRFAMASMSSVVPNVDGEAEALDTVPSLGAVILVQVDADVAGFERDEDKPAVPLERTVDTEAHNVLARIRHVPAPQPGSA